MEVQDGEVITGIVPPNVLQKLSRKIGQKDKFVCRRLGLLESDIANIEKDYEGQREQNYQMLLCWKYKNGQKATFETLYEALKEEGRTDLAEEFCTNGGKNGLHSQEKCMMKELERSHQANTKVVQASTSGQSSVPGKSSVPATLPVKRVTPCAYLRKGKKPGGIKNYKAINVAVKVLKIIEIRKGGWGRKKFSKRFQAHLKVGNGTDPYTDLKIFGSNKKKTVDFFKPGEDFFLENVSVCDTCINFNTEFSKVTMHDRPIEISEENRRQAEEEKVLTREEIFKFGQIGKICMFVVKVCDEEEKLNKKGKPFCLRKLIGKESANDLDEFELMLCGDIANVNFQEKKNYTFSKVKFVKKYNNFQTVQPCKQEMLPD